MVIECPCCKATLCVDLKKSVTSPLKGRELLNIYIRMSGKKVKVLGLEMKIMPNQLSNMRNGRVAIGEKRSLRLAEYFNHPNWKDFLTPRLKIYDN